MIKVGLTGGIGSGKTTIAKEFESLGVPVFYSDIESKKLLFDPQVKQGVIALFGSEAYRGDQLNREHIAQQVFSDSSKRTALEELVHPKVRAAFDLWVKQQEAPYVINESALLFEKNLEGYFDKIIFVKASLEDRINRVIKRDQSSIETVKARVQTQNDASKNEKLSDFVINNDNMATIRTQCLSIHNKLLNKLDNK